MEQFLYNRINKTPKINVWFAFPAMESFALSSLGYLSIFKNLDLSDDIFAERIYTDTTKTIAHLQDVSAIGFSNSFEIDILAIMEMLNKYKIPLNSKDRDEKCPLIFGGGPVLTSNPLPYQEFYDFISIGDAKDGFCEVFDILINNKDKPKDEILGKINELDYIWVPKFGKKPIKKYTDKIEEPCYTPILSEKSFFKNTFIIEIERGCPNKCNFCLASWLNLPVRFIEAQKIIDAIDFGLQYTNKIALLGAYVAGHPDFDKILAHIDEKNKISPIELTISSLRADLTSENVIKTLVDCGQKTATIAIEAGSERLRKVINKNLSQEQIENTVKIASSNGLKGFKIYLMVGHPTETDEDIKEIINTASKLKKINKTFDISFSLATFVPKAQTPFQWCQRENSKSLDKKIAYLKKELHKLGITLRASSVKWDDIQALLSRYPNSLFDYFVELNRRGANLGNFKHIWHEFEEKKLLPNFDKSIQMPISENIEDELPWDFIDVVSKNQLKNAYKTYLNKE